MGSYLSRRTITGRLQRRIGGHPTGHRCLDDCPHLSCSKRGLPSRCIAASLVGSYPTVAPLPQKEAVFISVALA